MIFLQTNGQEFRSFVSAVDRGLVRTGSMQPERVLEIGGCTRAATRTHWHVAVTSNHIH